MGLFCHEHVQTGRRGLSRRSFLHVVSAGSAAAGTLSFRDLMSLQAAELRRQGRAMILLWMQGGPSHLETFDPKPGTPGGGDTKAISTSVSGIRIANGWDQTAKAIQDIALIRSMTNKEGNHQRATYQMHTGYALSGSVKHPSLGANVARELTDPHLDLPAVVSMGPGRRFIPGAGFLGVDYEPFVVVDPGVLPQNVATMVPRVRYTRRLGLLSELEQDFASRGGRVVVDNHRQLYKKTAGMVLSPHVKAFDISDEPESLKEQYGNTSFGKSCLLARRLVEAGVTFVEVSLGGWDTHADIYNRMNRLTGETDPALVALVADLKERGMLEKTLVVWMGEFGRTPRINARGGRDHYPRVFNAAIAGGGIRGGQVIGQSDKGGTAVKDRPVQVNDLFCTICKSLHIDPRKERISPLGRPMKIVKGGKPVDQLFG